MRAEDLRAFARRRWDKVEALDVAWWVKRLRNDAEGGEAVRLGDELRRFVRATRPAWPDEASRASESTQTRAMFNTSARRSIASTP
jgi:hypothetical protein